MTASFYKQRKGKLVCGVVAGLADKYNWDLALSRVLIALILYFTKFGLLLY
ncbi:PspC domain-containing protein, partial [Streptococcus agalactiae]|nr:PspC domain-containing protein [Streptococcus agalactiae]MCK6379338.1 PspC domain-containing protein [Streptococcus agalactiae]